MKILIIEDNKDLSGAIISFLAGEGYLCESAVNFSQAIEKVQLYEYDCILLDISLPDGSGLDILKELNNMGKQDGVLIISAKDSLDDKLLGLKLGADDYLVKPFHLAELSMRVFSIIRRKKFNGNNEIKYDDICVDLTRRTVFYRGVETSRLSPKEWQLLLYLISSPGRIFTKGEIAEHLIGDHSYSFGSFDCVYAHVKNLKNKLKTAGCTEYIKTIHGMGYRFKPE